MEWHRHDGTAGLVRMMQEKERPDTRPFLRPIFRWCKHIVGKNQDERGIQTSVSAEDPTSRARWVARPKFLRALALSEYVVSLKVEGDSARGIPKQPQLQPVYCYNTLITMSQVCASSTQHHCRRRRRRRRRRRQNCHCRILRRHHPPIPPPPSAPAWPPRRRQHLGACSITIYDLMCSQ